jgi:uncharacterized protein
MHSTQKMLVFVMDLLKQKIPAEYHYHNYLHTQYIFEKAAEIGKAEHCSPENIELLKMAALWHDVGYINIYEGHEEEGCKLVKHYFPKFGVGEKDTEKVCGMIMATKFPQSPKNKLEEIIADADLEYLGTKNARSIADQLYLELKHRDPSLTPEEWNKTQISFINNHHYFTDYCKQHCEPVKQDYLNGLLHNRQ